MHIAIKLHHDVGVSRPVNFERRASRAARARIKLPAKRCCAPSISTATGCRPRNTKAVRIASAA